MKQRILIFSTPGGWFARIGQGKPRHMWGSHLDEEGALRLTRAYYPGFEVGVQPALLECEPNEEREGLFTTRAL